MIKIVVNIFITLMVVMGLLDSNKPNKIRNFLFSKENEFSETKVLIHLLVASGGKKTLGISLRSQAINLCMKFVFTFRRVGRFFIK